MKIQMVLLLFVPALTMYANQNNEVRPVRLAAEQRLARMGGMLDHPKYGKGCIAVVNAQNVVDLDSANDTVFDYLRKMFKIRVEMVKLPPSDADTARSKVKADYLVLIVNDENTPSTAIYPDDGYAVINIAKYRASLKLPDDQALYEQRCARGALKALVMLCRGGGKYTSNVASTHVPKDLDLVHNQIPFDIQESMIKYLEAAGVTATRQVTYRQACQEGWAPAPTNDVQKAIWDKVHAMPTAPIQIKPETKKVEK